MECLCRHAFCIRAEMYVILYSRSMAAIFDSSVIPTSDIPVPIQCVLQQTDNMEVADGI